MDVSFSCPTCQSVLQVAEALTGKQVRCPKCLAISMTPPQEKAVPMASLARVAQPATAIEQASMVPPLIHEVDDAAKSPSLWQVLCPACRMQLLVPQDAATLRCPACGAAFASQTPLPTTDSPATAGVEEDARINKARLLDHDAQRQTKGAVMFFRAAGVITLVVLLFNLASFFWAEGKSAETPRPAQRAPGNVGQDQFGGGRLPKARQLQKRSPESGLLRLAGSLGCGFVALVSAIFQFLAANALTNLRGKDKVIAAIVFALIFAVLFGIGVTLNLIALTLLLPDWAVRLAWISTILGVLAVAINLMAGVLGIIALNKGAVSRAFRVGKELAT